MRFRLVCLLTAVRPSRHLNFKDFRVGGLDERYEIVDRLEIKFYYYDIVVEKYVKKE